LVQPRHHYTVISKDCQQDPRALQERAPEAGVAVSSAKAYASDAYREVGNRGIQVQGGMGFTWENNVHLYYKLAKASELMFGDATYHRERIAHLVIDKL